MGIQIQRKKDKRVVKAFTHKLADIPGGVTVSAADLTQAVLHEGTPIGKDANGLYHVVKVAVVAAQAAGDATTYTVKKGHNFKAGDVIFFTKGGKAYTISAIATNSSDATCDDITVGTTLGAAAVGTEVYQSAANGATAGAFKHEPLALVGESYDVADLANHLVNAWTIGQIKEANIPPVGSAVKQALKGINFI